MERVMGNRESEESYYGFEKGTPGEQYARALATRKAGAVAVQRDATAESGAGPELSDFVLRIDLVSHDGGMPRMHPAVWRRVRVSGGATLRQFADRLLLPGFGFERNLHVCLFHDSRDGALFGPRDSDACDMTWKRVRGHDWLSDAQYRVADILRAVGGTPPLLGTQNPQRKRSTRFSFIWLNPQPASSNRSSLTPCPTRRPLCDRLRPRGQVLASHRRRGGTPHKRRTSIPPPLQLASLSRSLSLEKERPIEKERPAPRRLPCRSI